MSPIRPELSPRRHVWFGAKRCAEFARCLDAYRSPIELPYAFIRQSELRFNVHKKRFFALSRSFKRVVRSASESELSRSLDLLMEKWTSLYKHHRDEILEEDARSRKRSESPSHAPRVVAGDFQDMLKIVNAQSQHERKTALHKVVESGDALRVVLLVYKLAGLISFSIRDGSGRTVLEAADAAVRAEANDDKAKRRARDVAHPDVVLWNDNREWCPPHPKKRTAAVLIRDFLRTCARATRRASMLHGFRARVHDASFEIFRRRDVTADLRRKAKTGTYRDFVEMAAKIATEQLHGLCPFERIVDLQSSKLNGRTALEKSLERNPDDPDRKSIAMWLLRHGANPHRVCRAKLREEALSMYKEAGMRRTTTTTTTAMGVEEADEDDAQATKKGDVDDTKPCATPLAERFHSELHWSETHDSSMNTNDDDEEEEEEDDDEIELPKTAAIKESSEDDVSTVVAREETSNTNTPTPTTTDASPSSPSPVVSKSPDEERLRAFSKLSEVVDSPATQALEARTRELEAEISQLRAQLRKKSSTDQLFPSAPRPTRAPPPKGPTEKGAPHRTDSIRSMPSGFKSVDQGCDCLIS